MKRIWFVILVLGALLLRTNSVNYAQEDPVPVPPAPDTQQPLDIEAYVETAILGAESELRNYRIVYLVGENALTDDDVVAPSRLQNNFGALIAYDWQAVQNFNVESPVDAIILHETALEQADNAEMSTLFKHGVVVAFINIYHPHVADLLGLNCDFQDPETWYPGNFVVIYHLKVAAANQQDLDTAIEHYTTCGSGELEDSDLSAPIQTAHGTMNENLDVWYGYYALVTGVATNIVSVKEMDAIQEVLIERFGNSHKEE